MADHNNPQSRTEEILIATIDGTEYDKLPQSRLEELLLELKEVIEEGGGGGEGGLIQKIFLNGVEQQITNKAVYLTVITNTVNDLVNYYLKTDTYSKLEVNNLIAAIQTVHLQKVETLPTEDISQTTIYLVPKSTLLTNNVYDEYINTDGTSAGWELIGDTQIDLSDYVTFTDLEALLDDYVLATDLTTTLADYALASDMTAALALKANTADVTSALAGKVDKVTGKGLSTNDFTDEYKAAIGSNTSAITAIKDGQSIDSFADVETALDGVDAAVKLNTQDLTTSSRTKNILENTFNTGSLLGVDITESNGVIDLDGVGTGLNYFAIKSRTETGNYIYLPQGNYIFSADGIGDGVIVGTTYNGQFSEIAKNEEGESVEFSVDGNTQSDYKLSDGSVLIGIFIRIHNIEYNHNKVYPMIRLATETDATFAPYIQSVNSRLDAIKDGSTIDSFADVETALANKQDKYDTITYAQWQAMTPEQQAAKDYYISDYPSSVLTAGNIAYDNTSSGMAANKVQGAIDELGKMIGIRTLEITPDDTSTHYMYVDKPINKWYDALVIENISATTNSDQAMVTWVQGVNLTGDHANQSLIRYRAPIAGLTYKVMIVWFDIP